MVWLKLDLSDPREAKKAAEEFLEREGRLDILGKYVLLIFSEFLVLVFYLYMYIYILLY